MSSPITEIDIFALPPSGPNEEETATLTQEVQALRDELDALVRCAPPEDDEDLLVDKEDWCKRWTRLRARLTTQLALAQQQHLSLDLTVAERELGRQGNTTYDTFQREICAIKGTVAKTMDEVAQPKDQDEQHQEKSQPQDDIDQEHETQQHATHVRDTQVPKMHEKEAEKEEEDEEEDEEVEEVKEIPEKICVRAQVGNGSADSVDSEPEVEVEVAITAPNKMRKKITPRMSVNRKKLNAVACDRCTNARCPCYSNVAGMVCTDCKRLKAACSLVVGEHCAFLFSAHLKANASVLTKGKAKAKPITAPKPIQAPKLTPAAKPMPAPNSRPSPGPKRMVKGTTKPVVPLAPHNVPGLSTTTRPVVYIDNTSRKRKLAQVEEDEKQESDEEQESDGEEDAYMAGRMNALPGFIAMVETALGALKNDVAEMKTYMDRKRRRV
ncbi:hypothetical protein F4604DRAFT_1935443 [Suillus subluteus]|nr:hypothetical protein F4604DRAFT_1935443 [Suillus subluteus]